jgi:hypothetical protein
LLDVGVISTYGEAGERVSRFIDHSASDGARKILSLMRDLILSYRTRPFSALASDGRPMLPALLLGTLSWPRR